MQTSHRSRAAATLLLSIVALTTIASVGCGGTPVRPNILLLDLDTLRADHLGAYGYRRNTSPNIDALARRGSVFLRAYAQSGWTPPSQTSIMTSLYPTVHKVNQHGQVLDPDIPMLAEILQQNGYATAGFSQLMGSSFRRGFDEYTWRDGAWNEGPIDKNIEVAMRSMQQWVVQQSRPFFLFFHTFQVHLPYAPLERFAQRFGGDYEGPLLGKNITEEVLKESGGVQATATDREHVVAMYDAELAHLDEVIGRLLTFMEKRHLIDNTIVAVLADHGDEFGEHGIMARHGTLYNEVIRIPLIFAGPKVPAGRVFDQPVRGIDVAPTLVRLAGIEMPKIWQGSALDSIWEGEEEVAREVLSEQGNRAVLIADRFKYFSNGHLIDLKRDPTEQRNISAERPTMTRQMKFRLGELLAELRQQSARSVGPVDLTNEEMEQLRDLGYIR